MEKSFDTIDTVFIVIISIYLVTLFLFISIFIIKYYDLDTKYKNKKPTKFDIVTDKIYYFIINFFKKIFYFIAFPFKKLFKRK